MDMQEAMIKASGFYLTVNFNQQQAKDAITDHHTTLKIIEDNVWIFNEDIDASIVLTLIRDLAKEFVLVTKNF